MIKYITDWDKISLPAILLVLYSLLFPYFYISICRKTTQKNYFAENVNNCIIEREIIDRVSINGRDKLILKDALGYQTEKDITGIKDLKLVHLKKSWLTLEDIKIATMSLRDKQLLLK